MAVNFQNKKLMVVGGRVEPLAIDIVSDTTEHCQLNMARPD